MFAGSEEVALVKAGMYRCNSLLDAYANWLNVLLLSDHGNPIELNLQTM